MLIGNGLAALNCAGNWPHDKMGAEFNLFHASARTEMPDSTPIQIYDSQGDAYSKAFSVFLANTDQKTNASAWLEFEVDRLPRHDLFVDGGAGTGKLTAWIGARFRKTIAVEPNPSLREELQQTCPDAEVHSTLFSDTHLPAEADFVLCSHVLYYIDRSLWKATLEKLASWLRPGAVLAVAVQNHETDCMHMLRHFTGQEFNLLVLGETFAEETKGDFDVRIETVDAHVQTDSFDAAYTICEFMLNLLPMPHPPTRAALEAYIRKHFADGETFRMSCHQDFLRIHRRQ